MRGEFGNINEAEITSGITSPIPEIQQRYISMSSENLYTVDDNVAFKNAIKNNSLEELQSRYDFLESNKDFAYNALAADNLKQAILKLEDKRDNPDHYVFGKKKFWK